MQRAALPLALAVLAALLAAWWWGGQPGPPPQDGPPTTLWPRFSAQDVVSLRFIDKEPEGVLLQVEGAGWTLTEPGGVPSPALGGRARAMAAAFAGLTGVRPIAPGAPPSDYGLGPTALRVLGTLRDGSTRALVVGDPVTVGEGRYVGAGTPPKVYIAPEMPLALLLADPRDLVTPPEGAR
jgi:hypothetical protein